MAFFHTFALIFGCVLEETHGATVLEVGSEMLIAKHTLFLLYLHLFFDSWSCPLEIERGLFPHLHHFLDAFLKKRTARQFWKSKVKCSLKEEKLFYSTSTFF